MTQTMTKEQILDRNGFDFDAFQLENEYSAKAILKSMSEWEQQQLSAERERAGKLEHALKMCVDALKGLDATDYVAYTAGKVALIEYQQTLNEYDTATKES